MAKYEVFKWWSNGCTTDYGHTYTGPIRFCVRRDDGKFAVCERPTDEYGWVDDPSDVGNKMRHLTHKDAKAIADHMNYLDMKDKYEIKSWDLPTPGGLHVTMYYIGERDSSIALTNDGTWTHCGFVNLWMVSDRKLADAKLAELTKEANHGTA